MNIVRNKRAQRRAVKDIIVQCSYCYNVDEQTTEVAFTASANDVALCDENYLPLVALADGAEAIEYELSHMMDLDDETLIRAFCLEADTDGEDEAKEAIFEERRADFELMIRERIADMIETFFCKNPTPEMG